LISRLSSIKPESNESRATDAYVALRSRLITTLSVVVTSLGECALRQVRLESRNPCRCDWQGLCEGSDTVRERSSGPERNHMSYLFVADESALQGMRRAGRGFSLRGLHVRRLQGQYLRPASTALLLRLFIRIIILP